MVQYPYIIVGQTSNPSDINVILDKVQNAIDSIRTRQLTSGTAVASRASFVYLLAPNANLTTATVTSGFIPTLTSYTRGRTLSAGTFIGISSGSFTSAAIPTITTYTRGRTVSAGSFVGLTFASFASAFIPLLTSYLRARTISLGTVVATYGSFANGVTVVGPNNYITARYA